MAERCGFTLEGVLRRDSRAPDGSVRDTRVYARVRARGKRVAAEAAGRLSMAAAWTGPSLKKRIVGGATYLYHWLRNHNNLLVLFVAFLIVGGIWAFVNIAEEVTEGDTRAIRRVGGAGACACRTRTRRRMKSARRCRSGRNGSVRSAAT